MEWLFVFACLWPVADAGLDLPVDAPWPLLRLAEGTDPELAALLTRWVRVSERVASFEARVHRIVYDHIFQVEKRSSGEYTVLREGWRAVQEADEVSAGAVSAKMSRDGEPYSVERAYSETWLKTPKWIFRIDTDKKEVELFESRPCENRPQPEGWWDFLSRLFEDSICGAGPIPFACGASPEDITTRFQFVLMDDSVSEVRLKATPLLPMQASQYSSVEMILDRQTLATKAVKVLDLSGNEERVYVLRDVAINRRILDSAESLIPDLTGYRRTEHRVPARAE